MIEMVMIIINSKIISVTVMSLHYVIIIVVAVNKRSDLVSMST